MKARAMFMAAMGTAWLVVSAGFAYSQALETETARLPARQAYEVNSALEIQTSSEGAERAVPLAFEYGVTDRFSILLEPVPYTAIRPNTGKRATGAGDLELTCTIVARRERGAAPAFALAGEVKFPTARNTLIGTGRADYTVYAIASRRVGRFDLHTNLGYTIPGQPAGVQLQNVISGAVATVYHVNASVELFGEMLANTSALAEAGPENAPSANGTVAEISGGEMVGTLGAGARLFADARISVSLSYDNNHAILVRTGLTILGR